MNENTQVQNTQNNNTQNNNAQGTTKKITVKGVLAGLGMFAAGMATGAVGMYLYEKHNADNNTNSNSESAFI